MFRQLQLGTRRVDLDACEVTAQDGTTKPLTSLEQQLLIWLIDRAETAVSVQELLVHVWGYAPSVKTRAVANTISRLRNKIEDTPKEPRFLLSVYGVGYRFCLPEDAIATSGLIGRRRLLGTLREALRTARLVTLHGPAGVGKTVLARQLTGAVFVELAASASPEAAVAKTLALRSDSGVPLPVVIARALSARKTPLLILDMAEHLLGPVGQLVTALHQTDPLLRVLVTSRATLDIPGEQVIRVGTLGLSAAIALLRERAPDASADLLDDTISTSIVEQLDRLPLAISLAAGHLAYLSPARLLANLQDRIHTGGLREAFLWSWELLDADQQELLAVCSFFPGGFDLEQLEATTHSGVTLLPRLRALERFSLVERLDSPRLRVLGAFRPLAIAACESPFLQTCRARFCQQMVECARDMATRLLTSWTVALSTTLAASEPNVRAALPMASGNALGWLSLAIVCCGLDRGDVRDDMPLLERAIRATDDADLEGWLRLAAARTAFEAGDRHAAESLLSRTPPALSETLALRFAFQKAPTEGTEESFYRLHYALSSQALEAGDLALAANCIKRACHYLMAHRRFAEALMALAEAEVLAERSGDERIRTEVLLNRAGCWIETGRSAAAIPLLEALWSDDAHMPAPLRCEVGRMLAAAYAVAGDPSGRAVSLQAITLAQRAGLIVHEAMLANNHSATLDSAEAIPFLQSANVLLRLAKRHRRRTRILTNLAVRHALQGDHSESLDTLNAVRELLATHPDPALEGEVLALEVSALTRTGALAAARVRHAELEAAPRHLDPSQTLRGYSQSFLALAEGDRPRALALRETLQTETPSRYLGTLLDQFLAE